MTEVVAPPPLPPTVAVGGPISGEPRYLPLRRTSRRRLSSGVGRVNAGSPLPVHTTCTGRVAASIPG
jgi:hypothetical protein